VSTGVSEVGDPTSSYGARRGGRFAVKPFEETSVRPVARFARSDEGIAVTEYGLLVALIAVLLIAVVMIFGSSISSWFAARTSAITTS
jgi:Flp pilus assembly pilin Flp